MRDEAVVAGVEHRVVLAQPGRDVVGGQHGDLRWPGCRPAPPISRT